MRDVGGFVNVASPRAGEPAADSRVGVKPPPLPKILSVRPSRNTAGTLLAYLDVESPSGVQFLGCKLMTGPKGRRWLAMPAAVRRDSDGNPVLGPNGKPIWDQAVSFRSPAIREKFQSQVLGVLRQCNREFFRGEPSQ